MIKVSINRDANGNVVEFTVSGHAGYAVSGQDIICSAVSALTETAVGYAESQYNPEDKEVLRAFKQEDGFLHWRMPQNDGPLYDKLAPVMDAMVFGLKQIAESTGTDRKNKKYLVVSD